MSIDATNESFEEEVLNHKGFVAVKFWAPWCGPCKQMIEPFEALSGEFDVKTVSVNTDEMDRVSITQSIRGIPTIKLYKDGKAVAGIVGAVPASNLKRELEQHGVPRLEPVRTYETGNLDLDLAIGKVDESGSKGVPMKETVEIAGYYQGRRPAE